MSVKLKNGKSRELTNDERKAAEAAFQGRPFNSQWSESARAIYDGIFIAMLPRGFFNEERTINSLENVQRHDTCLK